MDQSLLRNLVKLKVFARRQFGKDVDVERIVADKEYAREILDLVEQSNDEDTLLLALTLKSELGILVAAPAKDESPPRKQSAGNKYIGGARGWTRN